MLRAQATGGLNLRKCNSNSNGVLDFINASFKKRSNETSEFTQDDELYAKIRNPRKQVSESTWR